MRTKVISLKNGSRSILYKNETTGEWTLDKTKAIDNFHKLVIEGKDKKARVIRKYYSEITISYTRDKIREMVNRNEKNVDLLYDTIINEVLTKR